MAHNNAQGQTGVEAFTPGIGTAIGGGIPLISPAIKGGTKAVKYLTRGADQKLEESILKALPVTAKENKVAGAIPKKVSNTYTVVKDIVDNPTLDEIGRASCRERVYSSV